jgi:hypothetical protein
MPKKRKKRGPSIKRLRSRNVGKVKCVDFHGNKVCAVGRKYGFSVVMLAKGETYPSAKATLPVHVPGRPRTADKALRDGVAWLKAVRKKQGLKP